MVLHVGDEIVLEVELLDRVLGAEEWELSKPVVGEVEHSQVVEGLGVEVVKLVRTADQSLEALHPVDFRKVRQVIPGEVQAPH